MSMKLGTKLPKGNVHWNSTAGVGIRMLARINAGGRNVVCKQGVKRRPYQWYALAAIPLVETIDGMHGPGWIAG